MSNCLHEKRRARADTSFFQELLSFCVWVWSQFSPDELLLYLPSSPDTTFIHCPWAAKYCTPRILKKNCTVHTSGIARWRDGGLGRVPREGLQPGPWTKVWIISFIQSHKCIRKAPENENNAYVTAEIVYLHIYKIYFGSEISKWGPSAINREFGILDCWHAIRGAPRTNFRLKLGIWPRRGGGGLTQSQLL